MKVILNADDRLFRKVLKGCFGLSYKQLWSLPFETRMGIRADAFDVLSALKTGCYSRPENLDPLTEQ